MQALSLFKKQQKEPEGQGFYVENSLINSVFGLFFWPVIFAEVPGAFYHAFQYRPDDLYDPDFLQSRQAEFNPLNKLLVNEANKPELSSGLIKQSAKSLLLRTRLFFGVS